MARYLLLGGFGCGVVCFCCVFVLEVWWFRVRLSVVSGAFACGFGWRFGLVSVCLPALVVCVVVVLW